MYLLDCLDEVLNNGSPVPFSTRRLVDVAQCIELVDQLRVALPEELRQARRIISERDAIIEEAQRRASRILQEAEEAAASRLADHPLVRAAEARAAEIEAEAEREAQRVIQGADDYALQILSNLEEDLEQVLRVVRAGKRRLSPSKPRKVIDEELSTP